LRPEQFIDVESIVDQTRTLRRDASTRVSTGRVELFAKTSSRLRVTRDLPGAGVVVDRVVESGIAVRVIEAGRDRAGFAASSGLSLDDVRWATESAAGYGAQASIAEPRATDVESDRWDLDEQASLPAEEILASAVAARTNVSWIEAGTTVEVLAGADGWIAARRRQRVWALADGSTPKLFAQRGFSGWEARLDAGEVDALGATQSRPGAGQALILTPRAAAPVVASLVDAFHRDPTAPRAAMGEGWDVVDEPVRADALAGGSFDDAGFPAKRRVLASLGLWVDGLTGPGSYRRSSFRDPPAEAASNLVMAGDPTASPPKMALIAEHARVIRSSQDVWVLELELSGASSAGADHRRWIRTSPADLIACCRSRLGGARLTPEGPIVPFLVFHGLRDL
jgi:hypothetical protein